MDMRKSKLREKLLENNIKIWRYDDNKIIIPFKYFNYSVISRIQKELSEEENKMLLIHFEEYNGSRKLISLEVNYGLQK